MSNVVENPVASEARAQQRPKQGIAGVDVTGRASGGLESEPGLGADQRVLDRGWLKIGAGLLVAGQAMVFSFAVNLSEITGAAYWIVHGLLITASLGVLLFLGGDLIRSAWVSIRTRRVSIDLLFLVTLCGALGGSLVSTFTHTGSVYYEVVAVLVVVHTAGKMLGARSRLAALQAVDLTRSNFDTCEIVSLDSEVTRHVRVEDLKSGDKVRVSPGGAIAVDGVIGAGRAFVQETSMTGEWRPVSRGPGERVLAGTFSVDGSLEVIPDLWDESGGRGGIGGRRLDGILSAVEQARLAPSVLQDQADRLIAWFLPLVTLVSMATFGYWFFLGSAGWERALFNAMAVLLVACPCAMGLATPVAVWGGLARLAGLGLVARTGDFLDALARADFVCFDKTGTLSADSLSVRAWYIAEKFSDREAWLRAGVLSVEEGVAHPVAKALVEDSRSTEKRIKVMERRIIPGAGIEAFVENPPGGRTKIAIGEHRISRGTAGVALGDFSDGKSVFVYVDDDLAAQIVVDEKWRDGATEVFAQLATLHVGAEVLTGDSRGADAGLAVEVRAGLLPVEKTARVESLVREGRRVVFLGDGVNDAAAMSVAHASVAMGSGSELAKASAMAVFAGDDLRFLPEAIRIARSARKSVYWNLRFAACYNIAGMALAATGWLHPVAAALLMVGSSVIVSASALRGSRAKA